MTIPSSVEQFFNHNQSVKFLDVLLPDINGLLRGKRLNREQALKPWKSGVALSASVYGFDVLGEPVEASGLSFDIGDKDNVCHPIDSTLTMAANGNAQVLLEMIDSDTKNVFPLSPRQCLKQQLDNLHCKNFFPTVAVELEFYLLKLGELPTPIDNPTTKTADTHPHTYLVDGLDDYSVFLNDVAHCAELQGLPADTAIVESSPGQFEINLHYRTDLLKACDEAIMLKRLIKQVAIKHGYQASFMAKPFSEHSGNGMHIHMALYNENQQNCFLDESTLHRAIAGLQTSMDDFMLVFAPHANSYRRMVAGAYVPLSPTWGENNRTVALRLPLCEKKDRRIEHRVSGADANPYLVVAALCAGVLLGIEKELTPSQPITGNAYAQVDPSLPLHWIDAQRAFQNSSIVKQFWGAQFQQLYHSVKHDELNQYVKQVPTLDYSWYLRTV